MNPLPDNALDLLPKDYRPIDCPCGSTDAEVDMVRAKLILRCGCGREVSVDYFLPPNAKSVPAIRRRMTAMLADLVALWNEGIIMGQGGLS